MTYSLGITGATANPVTSGIENYTIDDAFARPGDMLAAMRTGEQFLARGPDGAQRWYTYDAERSTPDRPILKPVGP